MWKIETPKAKTLLVLFLLGALLAPLGDISHVLTKTTSYPENYQHLFRLIPYWVPLQFGIATILIGITHHPIRRNSTSLNRKLPDYCLSALLLIFCYVISGALPWQPILSVICILGFFVFTYFRLSKDPKSLYLAFLTGCVGAVIEIGLIKCGVFRYTKNYQSLGVVPLWLPLLYGQASLVVSGFGEFLDLEVD